MELALGQYHRSGVFTLWKHVSKRQIYPRSGAHPWDLDLSLGERHRLGHSFDQLHDGHVLQHGDLMGCLLSGRLVPGIHRRAAVETLRPHLEYRMLCGRRRRRVPILVSVDERD